MPVVSLPFPSLRRQVFPQLPAWCQQKQGPLSSPELPRTALAIDLEIADQEGTTLEDLEDEEWPDYSERIAALERAFPKQTQTPEAACQFLDQDPWGGHLRILLPGQRELTPAQRRWLNTDTDIACYEVSVMIPPARPDAPGPLGAHPRRGNTCCPGQGGI